MWVLLLYVSIFYLIIFKCPILLQIKYKDGIWKFFFLSFFIMCMDIRENLVFGINFNSDIKVHKILEAHLPLAMFSVTDKYIYIYIYIHISISISIFLLWDLGHLLEKEMATHSSILTRRIPGTEEPGGLPSIK